MKMIFSLETRRLLGVHIVGEGATELIHIGQAVLNLQGHARLLHREHLQLSDAGRGLQDRRAGRLEPDDARVAADGSWIDNSRRVQLISEQRRRAVRDAGRAAGF